jgi:tRNA modification GTPase
LFEQDTIAAIATALGESSVGIVRVSGPDAKRVAEQTFRSVSGKTIQFGPTRTLMYGTVVHPKTGEAIDESILLWMPGPKSYTAEDVVELQVHGGIRPVQATLEAVLSAGARLAEPGEFTKRAFLNGRIDLSQAEAVIDLIRAKTDLASKSALNQVKGRFSDTIRSLRKRLIQLQAHVEVTIDYPEHDVESVACQEVVRVGSELIEQLQALARSAKFGQILREGVMTVIVGRPNVGKSSLMNALLRRERAIVTDIPGTTRDVLEEYVNVRGIPFRIVDTAGIRETSDVVEKIGVERSKEMVMEAEIALVVLDASRELSDEDIEILRSTERTPRIIVLNKMDLNAKIDENRVRELAKESPMVYISAKEAEGLANLEEAMERAIVGGQVTTMDASYMTNARQGRLLEEAEEDLKRAVEAAESGATLDIIAVQLQAAYASLGLVIGEEVGEDLLDEIFSQFCLGK